MPKDEHILLVRDNLSRYPAAEIVKSTAAKDVIPALDKIYSDFGNPLSHKTDNGPPFNSETFKNYSRENNIEHKRTPPLHPQSNEAECTMKPLGKAMKLAHHNKADKKQELNRFLKQYRATPHPSTGFAPGDIMFRAGFKTGQPKQSPPADIIEKVRERDKASKEKNNYVNNRRFTKRRDYVQGQLVLLQNDSRTKKFDPYFEKEPYLIMNRKGELLHLTRRSDGRCVHRHTSHVKPFYPRKPPPCPNSENIEPNTWDIEDETLRDSSEIPVDTPLNNSAHTEVQPDQPALLELPATPAGQVSVPPPAIDTSARRSGRVRTDTSDTKYKDFAT